jgi:cell division protein FtsB
MADRERGARGLVRVVALAALVVGGLVFAVQGGEFGTTDLLRQRRETQRLTRDVDSLGKVVDSLKRYKDKVEHDPATQERIAREVFGMVRGSKELLYRFGTARDTSK